MQSQTYLAHGALPLRLADAREAEHLGDYELAARILGDAWDGVGSRPRIEDLDEAEGAELLLRAGALTGYLGSSAQAAGAQEMALDLLSEAHTVFTRLGMSACVAEVRIELATCYRRQGFYDAARAMLDGASELLDVGDAYLRGLCAVRRVITETRAGDYEAALRFLAEAEWVIRASGNLGLRGRYYNEYGAVIYFLCERDGAPRLAEALKMFSASLRCVLRAGHLRYCAIAENNIGLVLVKLGRLAEARRHIQSARRLAQCVDDRGQLVLIEDTHNQLLIEQNRLGEAEAACRVRIDELAGTDHHALVAENLTTHAVALARLGRDAEAEEQFDRAVATAEFMCDPRGAAHIATLREAELRSKNVLPFRDAAERRALTFEWRMADDSLRDIGIRKGDALRFAVSERGRDGDVVAVLTRDGRFVKIVYTEGEGVVRLEGAHPRCFPRRFLREEVSILGVASARPD